MKRRPRISSSRRTKLSTSIATFSGLAAVAFVIILLVIGMRVDTGDPTPELVSVGTIPEGSIVIELSKGYRWIYDESDRDQISSFSIEEFQRRAVALTNGDIENTPVHILISDETQAGEITQTIEDLKKLGVRAYSISAK